MKKTIALILSLLLMTSGFTAFADKNISVELDGKILEFDVHPQILDGRTMVPLRKIFEEIGALVKWNGETQTVSARKNSKTITLTIDSAELQIDKGKTDEEGNPIIEIVALDVPAQIVDGRTLVPARAISESFGLLVDWDETDRKVSISSDDAEDDSWKENEGTVNLDDLTATGEGVEIAENQIAFTKGGDFTLTGTLENGNITVSAKERVKLRLAGVSITSEEGPCIFVEKADKAYITISGETENTLIAKNSEDGAIYSKENLEIKGEGNLTIESLAGHGIKASDNLSIEGGNMTIHATTDGIHINDTFKMTDGTLDIVSKCDGIDSESIVNISGGTVKIETTATPIETEPAEQPAERRGMWGEAQDVEFEKSSKGINAEWMMCISGGGFVINSASHAVHCGDEIVIDGGIFKIASKYDKGISAHGNLTVSGSETILDITKSTEGLESKNVLTINDGTISILSTDDAINATGGRSGMMMGPAPGTNGGAGGRREPQNGQAQNPAGNGRPAEGNNGNTRPNRGENMQPPTEFPQNGAFVPPEWVGENGEFTPPEWMGENGEFTPPDWMGENGEFFMPQGGNFTPPEGGMFGGFGGDMKVCLIINGGSITIYGEDDGLDANGNIQINGGIIRGAIANGSFSGNFGVIDSDGKTNISEKATILLAANSGNEKSLSATQNTIVVYCETAHAANEVITVLDVNGDVIYEYAPAGGFKAVWIASESLKTGETYQVTVGEETFETVIAEQTTILGTKPTGGAMGGPGRNRFQ